jgi:hypothetical protein
MNGHGDLRGRREGHDMNDRKILSITVQTIDYQENHQAKMSGQTPFRDLADECCEVLFPC